MGDMQAISVWRRRAACKGQEYLFDTNPKKAKKELCSVCPVADQCLKFAIIYSEHGIWGGTTKDGRDALILAQPLIRLMLIAEAKALGLYEHRYTVEQYWKSIRQAQDRGKIPYQKPVPIQQWDWNDPWTWQ